MRETPYILPHIFRWPVEQLQNSHSRIAVDVCVWRERKPKKRGTERETQPDSETASDRGERKRGGEREGGRERETEKREKRQRVEIEGTIEGEPLSVTISDKTAQEALTIPSLYYHIPVRHNERAREPQSVAFV